jgi:acetoin utilization deacetylase AcuC-like enzyme
VSTAYITHPRYIEHDLDSHPEHAGRIRAAWEQLALFDKRLSVIEAEPVSEDLLLRVHQPEYLRFLEKIGQTYQAPVLISADTYFTPTSYEIACLSAGGLVRAIDEVLTGKANNALALVRPPGHHALADRAMGFCIFANVVIGARHAQLNHHLDRVMIVDYDVHHGNGTQDLLYDDPHALFISTHQYPYYPGTGDVHETGSGDGIGFTVNIPLRAGHGDESYAAVFSDIIWPVAERYKPQLVLVSAGFDAHWDDPLANMRLSLGGYDHLTRELIRMAERFCDGKIVFVTEGGYNLSVLAHGVRNIAHALLGDETVSDPIGPAPERMSPPIQALISEIRRIHRL